MQWLRYYYQPCLQIVGIATLMIGGWTLWIVPAMVYVFDAVLDEALPQYMDIDIQMPFQDAILFLSSALMVAVVALWLGLVGQSFGTLQHNIPLMGSLVEVQPLWALAGGLFCVGLLISAVTNVAHEFCHRLDRPVQRFLGQVLLALAFHPSLPIEHVYGHHRNIGTFEDPATARRGEGFWRYMVRSVAGTYRNASRFEKRRLRKHGAIKQILFNRTHQGYAVLAAWWLSALAIGGMPGLLALWLVGALAMTIVELFQYLSHYGLVRVPGTPVRDAHSWAWSPLASSSLMLNLTRHGAHHRDSKCNFWKLYASTNAPTYPFGPNLMASAALIPPLFRHLAMNALSDWDKHFATADERDYAVRCMPSTLANRLRAEHAP